MCIITSQQCLSFFMTSEVGHVDVFSKPPRLKSANIVTS